MIRPTFDKVYMTEAEWILLDPIVPEMITAVCTDSGLQKLGDGVTVWSELTSTAGRYIGNKLVESDREPNDCEELLFCNSEDKWVFRLKGCILTQTEITTAALTVYPKFTMIMEKDDVTGVPTGRIKFGDGTNILSALPWLGESIVVLDSKIIKYAIALG